MIVSMNGTVVPTPASPSHAAPLLIEASSLLEKSFMLATCKRIAAGDRPCNNPLKTLMPLVTLDSIFVAPAITLGYWPR